MGNASVIDYFNKYDPIFRRQTPARDTRWIVARLMGWKEESHNRRTGKLVLQADIGSSNSTRPIEQSRIMREMTRIIKKRPV